RRSPGLRGRRGRKTSGPSSRSADRRQQPAAQQARLGKSFGTQRIRVGRGVSAYLDEPGGAKVREVVVGGRLRDAGLSRELRQVRRSIPETFEDSQSLRVAERAAELERPPSQVLIRTAGGGLHGVADQPCGFVLAEEHPRSSREVGN